MLGMDVQCSGEAVRTYFERLRLLLADVPEAQVERVVDMLLKARIDGRRVYVVGNGGSASTAAHLVCDLQKSATVTGAAPIRAIGLVDSAALMTAWANDFSYEQVFAGQITALVEPDDIVIAISASGNSPNILAALRAATARHAQTVAFVGFDGGIARQLADVAVHIPCHDYGLVEDVHSALGHAITAAIREVLTNETAS
ncbi:MAG: SIS domain-containing protein [Chloroflexota bacterium]